MCACALVLGCGDDAVPMVTSGTSGTGEDTTADSFTDETTFSTTTVGTTLPPPPPPTTGCFPGSEGCECGLAGECLPGLECIDDVCEACIEGTFGCPCIEGIACEFDLQCFDGICGPPEPFCGDGNIDFGEECDDGRGNDNEGVCKLDCTQQFCGDGFVGPGEACDDGNGFPGDDCTNECALPSCGDGILHEGEECDDGNSESGDACLNTCLEATCGDNIVWEGMEECDDGENGIETDACVGECIAAACGDSILWDGVEECDDGNVVDFDGCNADCAPTASIAWEDVWSGPLPGSCDGIYGLHVDNADNVIAVGGTNSNPDPNTDCNVIVRKYDTLGTELWTQTFASPAGACDEAWGVETDAGGNIFVSGTIYDPTPGIVRDQWLRKYGPAGNVMWTIVHNDGDEDFSYGAAVDSNGDVIMVGASQTGITGYDLTVRKLSGNNGSEIWTQTHDGASSLNDFALDVETRGTQIVVVGFETSAVENENAWIRKYNGNGGTLWTVTHNGAANGPDRAGGVAIDSADNVVVVGFEQGANNHDMWIAKYNSAGLPLWSDTYDNPDLLWADRLQDVAVDGADNVVAVGHEWAPGPGGNSFDLWMRKYTPDGIELWTQAENGTGQSDDFWYALEIDSGNHPVVGGSVSVPGQCRDLIVRKYNR